MATTNLDNYDERMRTLRSNIETFNNDYVEAAISALPTEPSNTEVLGTRKALVYWHGTAIYLLCNLISHARDCIGNSYSRSAVYCMTQAEMFITQIYEISTRAYLSTIITENTSSEFRVAISNVKTNLTTIRQLFNDINKFANDNNTNPASIISVKNTERLNIASATSVTKNINTCGLAKISSLTDAAYTKIDSIGESVESIMHPYFQGVKASSIKINLDNSINYLGTATSKLFSILSSLYNSVQSSETINHEGNTSTNSVYTYYTTSLRYVEESISKIGIVNHYLDDYNDNMGYNYTKFKDEGLGALYTLGATLYDEMDDIYINTYLGAARIIASETNDKYTEIEAYLDAAKNFRDIARYNAIISDSNMTNNNIKALTSNVETLTANVSKLTSKLNNISVRLDSLVKAHNEGLKIDVTDNVANDDNIDPLTNIDISTYISTIRTSIYGKDMRSAIADALDILYRKTNAKYLSAVACTYNEWVSSGSPDDNMVVYFIYDENMIIFKGIKYEFTFNGYTNVGSYQSINSGITRNTIANSSVTIDTPYWISMHENDI